MEFVQPIRNEKQIESMKKILKGTNMRDYVLFTLGINSGLRISDLLKLKDTDVLDEKGKVKDRIIVREQKTGKTKNFPIGSTTAKAIKEYYNGQAPTGAYLFASRKGEGPITRQQAYRVLNSAAREVGIKDKIGTHTLRKTFAYIAFSRGVDITRIQKLLNHSAPSVTLAYIGITQDELDSVYLDLNL